jgi:hypothetical protein
MPQPGNNVNNPENISRFLHLVQGSVSFSPVPPAGTRLEPLLCGCTILQTTVNKDREDEIRKMLEAA